MRRGKPLKRSKPLNKRAIKSNNPTRRRGKLPGATGWTQRVFALYGRTCVVCGQRATQGHHAVAKQTILARGDLDLAYDARNGVPICELCHGRHEKAFKRIPRARLPHGVLDWAYDNGFGWFVDKRDVYP